MSENIFKAFWDFLRYLVTRLQLKPYNWQQKSTFSLASLNTFCVIFPCLRYIFRACLSLTSTFCKPYNHSFLFIVRICCNLHQIWMSFSQTFFLTLTASQVMPPGDAVAVQNNPQATDEEREELRRKRAFSSSPCWSFHTDRILTSFQDLPNISPRMPLSLHPSLCAIWACVCVPIEERALNCHSLVWDWRYKTSGMPLPSLGCADDPAACCRTGILLATSLHPCLIFLCASHMALKERVTFPADAVSQKLLPVKSTKGLILDSPPPLYPPRPLC